ncbi:hypothetical protein A0H81_12293 [Grifola frondosa]|uniref:Uncharacterized protein n=1 Tax=Grifola frondosa TaxID=5627 RepID=A0A1C7LUR0_GRIFR|nr:hypothetical protein A0H81_12293 [Grifola frondosa]
MMSTPDLLTNRIYACLYARQDGGHDWALLSTGSTSTKSGVLYRATNDGGGSWRFECRDERVTRSRNVRLLVIIGRCGVLAPPLRALVVRPLETPARDGQERFTARVWMRRAIRMLDDAGVIQCSNIRALEDELDTFIDSCSSCAGAYRVLVSSCSA